MRALEARFHRRHCGRESTIVVGRVLCEGDWAVIQPAASVDGPETFNQEAALTKLRFLVAASLPRPYERLQMLKSEYWSFVSAGL